MSISDFSAIPGLVNPLVEPDKFKHFAFVVDGDVGFILRIEDSAHTEGRIACLLSGPQVVEITGSVRSVINGDGWTYDGSTFHPPA